MTEKIYLSGTINAVNIIFLAAGFVMGVFSRRIIRFLRKKINKENVWSIGIYMGESPFNLCPPAHFKNPVLTAKDISDKTALFVADPFMIKGNGIWYMFFEVMNAQTKKGEIGLATSKDGIAWTYKQIVLDEPFHVSYPYVFQFENTYYMIPESEETNSIRLYSAVDFPTKWSFETTLIEGHHFVDASVVCFDNKWWMFTSNNECDNLYLYYADTLTGHWNEHPKSPVIMGNPHMARLGGRVIVFDDKIFRFAQDDKPFYGSHLRAFEIIRLKTTKYEEKEVAVDLMIKATGSGWNKKGMHHIDPHHLGNGKWIACVDGIGNA